MIINKENFWHEVKLVASNNYGPWTTREDAVIKVNQAINDTLEFIRMNEIANDGLEVNNLVDDMMEASND